MKIHRLLSDKSRSILVRVASGDELFRAGKKEAIWLGMFDSWQSCADYSQHLTTATTEVSAFTTDRWVRRQEAMYLSATKGDFPRATSLPPVVEMTGEHKIYDFGGGSGWGIELLSEVSLSNLSAYIVIEQPKFVERLNIKTSRSKKLTFCSLSDVYESSNSSSGLLYANSALQYLSSDEEIHSLIQKTRPNWILIDDLQVSTGGEFFSLQKYYGQFIPCRFYSPSKLCDFLKTLGYLQVFCFPYEKRYSEVTAPTIEGHVDSLPNIGAPLIVGFRLLRHRDMKS